MAIAPLRRGLPIDTPRERPPSPRQVTHWITTAPSRRDLHTTEALRRLLAHCPELTRTHDLVRQFAAMLDTRDARPLAHWLEQLSNAGLPALASLANAIREDQPAVEQAVATLKSWRLLRKLRCSTTRITSLVQAVLTLHLTCSG